MKKIFSNILIAGAIVASVAACNKADRFDYGKEALLITGTELTPMSSIAVSTNAEEYPITYDVTVTATGVVAEDVTVHMAYDLSALEKYNAEHNTVYQPVPENALTFPAGSVTIKKGNAVSTPFKVQINNINFVEEGVIYMIPVSITKVEGTTMEVLQASKSVFHKIKRRINFWALDIDNPQLSANYNFQGSIELPTWTYQVKCYPYHLKQAGAEQICRLCAWKTDGDQCMLRFNENGTPWKTLQVVTPSAGNYVTGYTFEPNEWYMITMVWDGTKFRCYINGNEDKDPNKAVLAPDMSTTFSRFELGMAYGGYNVGQLFSGRISEVRIWDRAISVTEMNETYCGVAKDAPGLKVCWRFNEGSGHVFHNHTGDSAWDMDWSNAVYEYNDNVWTPVNKSEAAEKGWVKDELNICAE